MVDSDSVVTLCLLNIRSLRKHSCDIKSDENLFKSEILALTETQLSPGDSDSDIRAHLTPFTLYRHDHNSDKFSSLGICIKSTIHIVYHKHFVNLNAVKFQVAFGNNVEQQNISFLLVYQKNSSKILQFVNSLDYLLRAHTIDIILGDLNINYFNGKDVEPLASLMASFSYVQIVKKPTFMSGSLLDHVYIKQPIEPNIHCSVISVYYSDHDAIRITIPI